MSPASDSLVARPEIKKVLRRVLDKVVPREEEREFIKNIAERVRKEIEDSLAEIPVPFSVEIHGSFAHDTWLSGDRDIDIFILLREYKPKSFLEDLLKIIENRLPYEFERRYAEHPYLHAYIDGLEVDIVPGYSIENKILSAVDRTPRHTRFLKQYLNEELCNEIRLLKAFLKGIDAYGAEIRTQGLSGYACELLIIHYKSFLRTITEIAQKPRIFIDFTNTWEEEEAIKTFRRRIIIIDPTDTERNVTANLSTQTFLKIKLASKLFLEKPSTTYFFPKEKNLSEKILRKSIRERSIILIQLFIKEGVSPDTYWGQAKRILRKIRQFLKRMREVEVYNYEITETRGRIMLFLELNTKELSRYKKVLGPPIWASSKNILDFIIKHYDEIGPIISIGSRIFFIEKRSANERSIAEILKNFLDTIKIEPSFTSISVHDNPEEIVKIILEEDVSGKLYQFVTGKPPWLPEI